MCRPVYCSGLGATTIGVEASLQCQCHVDVVCPEGLGNVANDGAVVVACGVQSVNTVVSLVCGYGR